MGSVYFSCAILLVILQCGDLASADNTDQDQDQDILVVADSGGGPDYRGKVLKCFPANSSCTSMMLQSQNPRYPVYDPVEDYIYWTDNHHDTICRVSFSGDNHDNHWISLSTNPSGLAIDVDRRVLFLNAGTLKRVDMKTRVMTTLSRSVMYGALTLDTLNRKIYLSEVDKDEINVFNYEGGELGTLLDGFSEPRGIALNGTETLYYCDKGRRRFGSLDIRTNVTRILREDVNCLSLAVWGHKLYYTDMSIRGKVFVLDQLSSLDTEITFGHVSDWGRVAAARRFGCSQGYYGRRCVVKCGNCVNRTGCDAVTGRCLDGCARWLGHVCRAGCPQDYYGRECREKCGHCQSGTGCDGVTGRCFGSCAAGWVGHVCKAACPIGSYGENCGNACGHCKSGDSCDHVTGVCAAGCEPGWTGNMCLQECSQDTYGENCSNICGHCKPDGSCDHVTGVCTAGCEADWTGSSCTMKLQACPAGTYGETCSHVCGHCKSGDSCDHVTGVCAAGCEAGWTGNMCLQETDQQGSWTLVYVLVSVCCVLALFLLVTVVLLVRKHREWKPFHKGSHEMLWCQAEANVYKSPESHEM